MWALMQGRATIRKDSTLNSLHTLARNLCIIIRRAMAVRVRGKLRYLGGTVTSDLTRLPEATGVTLQVVLTLATFSHSFPLLSTHIQLFSKLRWPQGAPQTISQPPFNPRISHTPSSLSPLTILKPLPPRSTPLATIPTRTITTTPLPLASLNSPLSHTHHMGVA